MLCCCLLVCQCDEAPRHTGKAVYKWHAMQARTTLRSWAKKENSNSSHHVNAEYASSCSKNHERSIRFYQEACRLASNSGCVQDAGMDHDRCGEFLLYSQSSSSHHKQAGLCHRRVVVDCYQRWGAVANVRSLAGKYGNIFDHTAQAPQNKH